VAAPWRVVVEGLRPPPRRAAGAPAPDRDEAAVRSGRRFHEVLMRGLPIPRYPHLRWACRQAALVRLWATAARRRAHRHRRAAGLVGAAGGAAPEAARLGLPHQLPRLQPALRRRLAASPSWPTCASSTTAPAARWCPPSAAARLLGQLGFRRLHVVVARGVDTRLFDPRGAAPSLRAQWGVSDAGHWWWPASAGWRRKEPAPAGRRPSRPCRTRQPRAGWCWWATARCAPHCRRGCPRAIFAGSARRRPGGALRVGRSVPVPQPDRDLRQRLVPRPWPAACRWWPSTTPPRRR
jgi:hypothetical protein